MVQDGFTAIVLGDNDDRDRESFLEVLEKHKEEYDEFLKLRQSQLSQSFETLVVTCRALINRCIETNCPASSYFIREMTNVGYSQIRRFEEAARDYLECLSEILNRNLKRSRLVSSFNVNEQFTDILMPELKELKAELENMLDSEAKQLSEYRIDKREEIRKVNAEAIQQHERSLLQEQDEMIGICFGIDLVDYGATKRLIASGGEGSVFRYHIPGHYFGETRGDLVTVAAKKFEKSRAFARNKTGYDAAGGTQEVVALCKLHHTNIVRFLGTGQLDSDRYLLMEYYPRDLDEEIGLCRKRNKFLKLSKFTQWTSEIATLHYVHRYVHDENFVHGDLKPKNILLDRKDSVKLADKPFSSRFEICQGTARYMSPEQHKGERLITDGLKRCDVWSYGVVLWEMLTCREPYADIEEHLIPPIICANERYSHPLLPGSCTAESLFNLLMKCWNADSAARPLFHDISTSFLPDIIEELEQEFPKDSMWAEECRTWAWAEAEREKEPLVQQTQSVQRFQQAKHDNVTEEAQLLDRIRSLLDSVEPTTFDRLTKTFMGCKVNDHWMIMNDVIELIFSRAAERSEHAQLYAKMCAAQKSCDFASRSYSNFHSAVISYIQRIDHDTRDYNRVVADKETEALAEQGEKKKMQKQEELTEMKKYFQERTFARNMFLGHLYLLDVIPSKIINSAVVALLKTITNDLPEQDDDSIVCAIHLLELCGARLQGEIARVMLEQPGLSLLFDINSTVNILIAAAPRVSNRVRDSIERLAALRSNGREKIE
ncbi:hypothetical protein PRIPAC_89861 [Pristionchus pacificus]|nr:hypothetical protein PRIPAC_89861 [Pristionchus pacificus]